MKGMETRMRRTLAAIIVLAATGTVAAQEPPLIPGANPPIHGIDRGSIGDIPTDMVALYRVHFRGEPFCGETWAEVPKPVELLAWNMKDVGKLIGKKDVEDALFEGVATVDAAGRVSEIQLKSVWRTGAKYEPAFREAARLWTFKPGQPGKVCVNLAVDIGGEVTALFDEPKRPAPTPTVATEIPYPELAYENNISGSVLLSIEINRDSQVTAVRVIQEEPGGYAFGIAAAETVKSEWRFDGAQAGRYRLKLKFAR